MSIKRRLLTTLLGVVFAPLTLVGVGVLIEMFGWTGESGVKVLHPAPHTVSQLKGQTSLRLAMVHDVLLDRHLVHSDAYWQARLKIAKEVLEKGHALDGQFKGTLSKEVLDAFDVYGVSLDKLHRSKKAVAVMRNKLALLQRENPPFKVDAEAVKAFTYYQLTDKLRENKDLTEVDKSFYRTYANLGTFLIHASFKGLLDGNKESRAQIVEGIGHIKTAIYINPGAHFGRETWQYVAANHLLYSLDHKDKRLDYDITGNSLKSLNSGGLTTDRIRLSHALKILYQHQANPEAFPLDFEDRFQIRLHISSIGNTRPLSQGDVFIPEAVPFDEPTLGIIGMWTLGGGANPHFSLALANNMMQVGQKYIAWTGYERTKRLAQRFWKEDEFHKALIEFCNKTQKAIEDGVPESGAELRAEFDAELAFGQSYQRDYKAYEERRLKEGLAPNSEGFYDDFFKGREPISTDVGEEDELLGTPPAKGGLALLIGALLLGFGFGAYLAGTMK